MSPNKIFILILLLHTIVLSQNKVAFTIDDLPLQRIENFNQEQNQSTTEKLIKKIVAQKVPAIGFVNESKLYSDGKLIPHRVDLLKSWLAAGLELGNHTFSHNSANKVSVEEFTKDIVRGEEISKPLVKSYNSALRYFRHPYLHTGLSLDSKTAIENFLTEHDYKVAPVTIDNSEWIYAAAYDKAVKEKNNEMMLKIGKDYLAYMKSKLEYWQGQSIALFGRNITHTLLIHANELNAEYFDKLCSIFQEKNYKFVSLDEALQDDAYKSTNTFIKNNGISWLHRWAITQGKKREFFDNEPEASKWVMDYAGINYE